MIYLSRRILYKVQIYCQNTFGVNEMSIFQLDFPTEMFYLESYEVSLPFVTRRIRTAEYEENFCGWGEARARYF